MRNHFLERLAENLVSGPKVLLYRIIFFLCLLGPIVFLGVSNYARTYRKETEIVLTQKKALSYLVATTIHERLDAFVNLGISLATRKLTIEGAEKGDWLEAISVMKDLINQFPEIDRAILFDTDATIREATPPIPEAIGQSRADKEWYPEIKKHWMPYVSAVYKRGTKPQINVISILTPIKAAGVVVNRDSSSPEERQKVFGLFQMQFKLDTFSKWLAGVDAGPGGFIYIVDQKGRVVYHPKFNVNDKVIDFSSVPLVQDVLKGKSGARLNYNPVEKELRVAAFEPVPGYGWGVIMTQPAVLAFLQRDRALWGLVIIYGIVFAMVFGLGCFILHTMTIQRRMGEKLRQLMRAVEQSPATIVITNLKGTIEYANPKFTELTGYSLKEAMGQNPRILKSGKHSQEFYKKLWDTILAGKEWRGEFYNKKKNGEFFWEAASISPVKDVEERVTHFIAVKEDITARKRMEERLAVSAREWEDTFNALPDLISIHDKDFKIVRVNKAYANFFKMKPEEFIGKLCFSVLHQTSCMFENCPHAKAMETNAPQTIEYFEPRFGLYLEVSTSPIVDDASKPIGTVHVVKNITERKKAEEALKKLAAIKSDFTSMVSHELRTPLGPIKEGAGIILDGLVGEINAEQRELLMIVKTNADRLNRLIDNVLDFQKLESGRVPFDLREYSIVDVIKEVARTMSLMANQKHLELTVECAENIPRIRFDRDKIVQVLTNLINNAIKFTDQGTIKIKAMVQSNMVCVAIEDTGPGMAAEDLPKLFESFQQLKGLNDRKTGGTGLGLVISKEIITRHNGKIWVESKLGKGSVFSFLLPIEDRRARNV